jgi:hypothetical protein
LFLCAEILYESNIQKKKLTDTMKPLQLLTLLLLPICLTAQSKHIAFLSHSGREANFEKALAHSSMFGADNSDFGILMEPSVRYARLDSLIAIDEHTIVMVTSANICPLNLTPETQNDIWRPGRDTILDHPDFGNIHQLDLAKGRLINNYYFDNSTPTVFVGYDNRYMPNKDHGAISVKPKGVATDPQQQPEQTQDSALHNQLNAIPFSTGGPSNKTVAVALWLMVAFLVSLLVGAASFLMRRRALRACWGFGA